MNRFKFAVVSVAFILLSFILLTPILSAEDAAPAAEPAVENKETKMLTDEEVRAALNANQGQGITTDSNAVQKIELLQSKLLEDGGKLTALNEQAEKLVPEIQAGCVNAEAPECGILKQKAEEILKKATDLRDQMKQDQTQLWEIMTEEQQAAQPIPNS